MTILAGWVIDRIGHQAGPALSLVVWSVFGISQRLRRTAVTMHVLIRSAFGVGEAGNFPASIKTVAEWFPQAGTRVGHRHFQQRLQLRRHARRVVCALVSHLFGNERGWKLAFILTGAAGFIWLIFWFWLYDTPGKSKRLSQMEYEPYPQRPGRSAAGRKARQKTGHPFVHVYRRVPRSAFWGVTIMIHLFVSSFISSPKKSSAARAPEPARADLFRHHGRGGPGRQSGVACPALARFKPVGLAGRDLYSARVAGLVSLSVFGFEKQNLSDPGGPGVLAMTLVGGWAGSATPGRFGNPGSRGLLGHRQTWSFFAGKLMTDGVWWFYLFWLPTI